MLDLFVDGQRWTWIAVGDSKTCPDCLARHARNEHEDYWNENGWAGDGATICGMNCRCLVFRDDTIQRIIGHLGMSNLMASQFDDLFDDVVEPEIEEEDDV